jgi:hypothetical protein
MTVRTVVYAAWMTMSVVVSVFGSIVQSVPTALMGVTYAILGLTTVVFANNIKEKP